MSTKIVMLESTMESYVKELKELAEKIMSAANCNDPDFDFEDVAEDIYNCANELDDEGAFLEDLFTDLPDFIDSIDFDNGAISSLNILEKKMDEAYGWSNR